MQRHIILLPMRGSPRILPAASASSLVAQIEDLVGGHFVATPAVEWLGDRHHLAVLARAMVGTETNANTLAGRVLGVPMHGPCVLARRPDDDRSFFREGRPDDRRAVPFETQQARAVLAALGSEIEGMHHAS